MRLSLIGSVKMAIGVEIAEMLFVLVLERRR